MTEIRPVVVLSEQCVEHAFAELERQAYERLRAKFDPKHPCPNVQPAGFLEVGLTEDEKMVALQFRNPDWWIHFTPDEARGLARLLLKKADETVG